MRQLHLSARAYRHGLKLARVIADVAGVLNLEPAHPADVIHYRPRSMQ